MTGPHSIKDGLVEAPNGHSDAGAASLPLLAAQALASDPAARVIEFEGCWHHWGELAETARAIERLLEAAAVQAGSPVALVARNRPAMVAALLGLIAAGRSVQMIYAFQSASVIARDVEALRPAAVIVMAEDASQALQRVLAAHGIAGVMLDGATPHPIARADRARDGGATPLAEPQIEVLTSGTTGPPKRFPIPFDMIVRHHLPHAMAGGRPGSAEPTAPALLFFPLGNISGIYSTIPALLRGQTATLLDRFTLEAWRAYVRRHRPVASGIPPATFRALLDADIPPEELASLKVLSTGAAPLDPMLQRAFEERYGIPVLLSYGATEFGGPVAMMTAQLAARFGRAKLGTVGRAMPGAALRVVDPISGAPLPPGEEGLLEVVSPRVGPDWIRTADIAVIDADEFLFIRGRADGAIIRGGFKLVPETIERALLLHPAVGAAAVVGVADARLGQVPAAAIQPCPDATASPEELEAHLRDHIPSTHIPARWAFFDDLPKNPSMKIDRPTIRRHFEQQA